MNVIEIISLVLGSNIINTVITWVLSKKKYSVEVDNSIIEGMKESLEFYKTLSTDNKERLEEMIRRNDSLESELEDVKKQVFNLMGSICMDLTCALRKRDINLFDSVRYGNSTEENDKKS